MKSMRKEQRTRDGFWYLVTTAGAHVQVFCVSEKNPQGQGCTRSDMVFLLAKGEKGDFEGTFYKLSRLYPLN